MGDFCSILDIFPPVVCMTHSFLIVVLKENIRLCRGSGMSNSLWPSGYNFCCIHAMSHHARTSNTWCSMKRKPVSEHNKHNKHNKHQVHHISWLLCPRALQWERERSQCFVTDITNCAVSCILCYCCPG